MKPHKILLSLLLVMASMFFSHATPLKSYEYWLDDNYDGRIAAESSDEDQSFMIDISTTVSGFHFLNYRAFTDNGIVGSLSRWLFYIPELRSNSTELIGYEYWIDDDYDSRIVAQSSEEDQTFMLDLNSRVFS